ncbi:hypothetical protein DBR24_07890 [Pseudomonas sp. HMWF006]|nr:hypothetical protein DBR24_07890 [Pseudomonas sp. HMWF006]PTT61965.1 hypothetical protein DBR26_25550 [Pseudomonas sp. HMWF007]PTT93674.1 hypothetical protein DBR29_06160 [Pseudomonas sp. HMWF005]
MKTFKAVVGGKWGQTTVLVITRKRGLSPFFLVPFFSSQNPAVSRNIDTWGAAHDANERKVLDLYGNNRRMTNPSLRYNHLKAGL